MLAPFIIGIVFLGLYPKPVLERIEPAVHNLISHLEEHSDFVEPDLGQPIIVIDHSSSEDDH